jgi:hypothetical protein
MENIQINPPDSFKTCGDIQATYVEVLNVISSFNISQTKGDVSNDAMRNAISSVDLSSLTQSKLFSDWESVNPSGALLRSQLVIKTVYDLIDCKDMSKAHNKIVKHACTSYNLAITILEKIPEVTSTWMSTKLASTLCNLYVDICFATSTPEILALAVNNLAEAIDYLLASNSCQNLPGSSILSQLWMSWQTGQINPAFSNAIIRASGSILAAMESRPKGLELVTLDVPSWGLMIGDAGLDDKVRDFLSVIPQSEIRS